MTKRKKILTIKVVTLFPQFIESFVESFGLVKKAIKNHLLKIETINLRQFGVGLRQTVDDRPYGGGVGMLLKPDVVYAAIQAARSKGHLGGRRTRSILLTPQGQKFNQKMAQRLARFDELILVSGRYEGFDERIRKFVDEEISIGDYVLMGGELPALVITEAVMRLRAGILGKDESADQESFSENLLEYPQYTKPEIWEVEGKTLSVPKILLTGHHQRIQEWRHQQAIRRTKKRRADLLK